MQEGWSEQSSPPQNHLVPKPLCRGQAWHLGAARALPGCGAVLRDAPEHQSTLTSPTGPHTVPSPHHPTSWPSSLAPLAPAFPKWPREAPSPGVWGVGAQWAWPPGMCGGAGEHAWAAQQPQGGAATHPKLLLAAALAPSVTAKRPPPPSSTKPHRALRKGPNTAFMKEGNPHLHTHTHTHTHTQRPIHKEG